MEEKVDRHCAFCLTFIKAENVKTCSKCHKRAYCSIECQTKDWKIKIKKDGRSYGVGQGHTSWCGLPYGEEDLDWIIAPVPGKGQGVVAKRFIPAKTRIMVDGFNGDIMADPGFASRSVGRAKIPNHSCDANAAKMPDPDFKTMIVYSKKDIQAGEEICVNYIIYDQVYCVLPDSRRNGKLMDSFAAGRDYLEAMFRITCPSNCYCRDDRVEELIKEGRLMQQCILSEGERYSVKDADVKLGYVKKLLENCQQVHANLIQKAQVLELGFNVAVQQKSSLKMAKKFIKEAYEIWSSVLHPMCVLAVRVEKLMNNPKTSEKYLALRK